MKKEALRVSTTIPSAPTTVYFAWLSSEQHSAMTGGAATIDPNVGAPFTAADGYIQGKLVILDLGRRIVMSWRTTDFPREEHDSRVEVHLEALGGSTRLTVIHTDIPEGQAEKYRQYWNDKYFSPMRTYFSKYLPDPRLPPPPRPPPPEMDDEDEVKETPLAKLKGKVAAAKGTLPSAAKSSMNVKTAASSPAPSKPAPKPAPAAAPAPSASVPPAAKKAPAKPAAKKPASAPAKEAPAKKAGKAPAKAKAPAKPKAKAGKSAKPAKPAKKSAAKAAKKKR